MYTEKRTIRVETDGSGTGSGRFPDFTGKMVGFQMNSGSLTAGGSFVCTAATARTQFTIADIQSEEDTAFRDCTLPVILADGTEDPAARVQRSIDDYVTVAIADGGASKFAYFDLFIEGTFRG